MKTLLIIITLLFTLSSKAQSTVKTVTISVQGNCDECKERIENAADIKGVKLCTWNKDTKVASITYVPEKVTLNQIEKAIAKAGYDAGSEKATNAAYTKLPNCCQYKAGKCDKK